MQQYGLKNILNERTKLAAKPFPRLWWSYIFAYTLTALVFQLLIYFRSYWVPHWLQGLALIVFFVLAVFNVLYITYHFTQNIEGYRQDFRTIRFVFKPIMLFACVALMVLSWIVALFMYNLMWSLVALCTTLLALTIGFFSLRNAVQQIQSTETDIL